MKKALSRVFSYLLTAALCCFMLPIAAFGDNADQNTFEAGVYGSANSDFENDNNVD